MGSAVEKSSTSATTGLVDGPATSTDNALVRWNGTDGLSAQDGVLTSADINGDIGGPTATTTTTGVGLAFTNQPANDGVEIGSDSAADTTQTVTIIGTTQGTDTVVVETKTLTGVTFVATTKTDWGVILAVKLSASCAGTVTVREASGDATITTLATTVTSKGVETVAGAQQNAWNRVVYLVSDGATTKQIGLKGTNSSDAVIYDSQALTGTTTVQSNSSFKTVTEIYTGDLESGRTATQTAVSGVKVNSSIVAVGSHPITFTGPTEPRTVTLPDAAFTVVGTTQTQTLTNKTIATADNTITASSTTASGVIECAIASEINTGTDATRAVTPDSLAGSNLGIRLIQVKVFDDATAATTGDGKAIFCIPAEFNGMNLVSVAAYVTGVSSSGNLTIQVRNVTQAADMLSTAITIEVSENHSKDATTQPVIDTANDDVATGDLIAIDVDGAGTSAEGLGVICGFQLP